MGINETRIVYEAVKPPVIHENVLPVLLAAKTRAARLDKVQNRMQAMKL